MCIYIYIYYIYTYRMVEARFYLVSFHLRRKRRVFSVFCTGPARCRHPLCPVTGQGLTPPMGRPWVAWVGVPGCVSSACSLSRDAKNSLAYCITVFPRCFALVLEADHCGRQSIHEAPWRKHSFPWVWLTDSFIYPIKKDRAMTPSA